MFALRKVNRRETRTIVWKVEDFFMKSHNKKPTVVINLTNSNQVDLFGLPTEIVEIGSIAESATKHYVLARMNRGNYRFDFNNQELATSFIDSINKAKQMYY